MYSLFLYRVRFFLTKGKVAVLFNGNVTSILTQGSYFGEIGCLMGGIRRGKPNDLLTAYVFFFFHLIDLSTILY